MKEGVVMDNPSRINDVEQEEQIDVLTAVGKPTLSKSWSIASAHVPCFTGGKMVHCQKGIPYQHDGCTKIPFLLLSVGGDVAVVHADRGTKLATVRGQDGSISQQQDRDDDDDVDTEAITAFALSSKDDMIVTCSRNQLIRQYSLSSRQDTNTIDDDQANITLLSMPQVRIQLSKTWGRSGHTLPVTEMEFHMSSVFLATGSVDGVVRIWDVRGGFVTHVFRRPENATSGNLGSVTTLSWRPQLEELILAIGRDDGGITIHDLRDQGNHNVVVLRDHVSAVTCLQWALPGYLLSAGRDAILNTWKISTVSDNKKKSKKKEKTLSFSRIQTLPIYEQVEGMVLIPRQARGIVVVATAGSKGCVRLWQAKSTTTDTLGKFSLLSEQHDSFGESRGGYMQLSCLTPTEEGGETKTSHQQLLVADAEHNLSFLSLQPNSILETVRTIVGHNDEILDLRVIPSTESKAKRIVVVNNSAQVRLFDLETFSCRVLNGHEATVLCVDVSPCGTYLATCSKDKTMRVWHTQSETCVAIGAGHTEAIGATALSRKVGKYQVGGKAAKNGAGAYCVTASKDRTLKRWNLPGSSDLDAVATNKGEAVQLKASASARAHEKDINMVSVAPNDSLVASASQDKMVKLWKSTDLSLVATLKGHRRGVWDCQFSPVDRVLASSSADRTIKVWSLSDYTCVRTFQGHVSSVLRIRFLTGGLQLVSSGADGLIKLWTVRTMECEATLDKHNNKVWALDLSPDGTTMVSGGADSQILVWTDTTQHEEEVQRVQEEKDLLMEQQLANHLRRMEWPQALSVCLDMDKPRQTLKVFTAIVEDELERTYEQTMSSKIITNTGLESLQKQVKTWPMSRTTQVLRYCREWNTRAINSHVAMLVVQAVVTSIPARELALAEGVPEIMAGIIPYAERHFARLDRLVTSAHLLSYTLFCMGDLEHTNVSTEDYAKWEATSKFVLPPKQVEGRFQVGGRTVVGRTAKGATLTEDEDLKSIGDSDSSVSEVEENETDLKENDAMDEDESDSISANDDTEDDDASESVDDNDASQSS